MPIRKLPPLLVNQIAAGEVIERPASVVKELVENSLDAGARRIDVRVEDGGRQLIRVSDDGAGIVPEELPLAVAPHATSKLQRPEQLGAIATLGFRGEALASIASVSRLRLSSRATLAGQVAEAGAVIEASGDHVGPVTPEASAPGTVIEVRDLFLNTPARRKFMRAAPTEFGHIADVVSRIALVHPEVTFTLAHGTRTTLEVAAGASRRQRCVEILGKELDEALLEFESALDLMDVGVSGSYSEPETRNSRLETKIWGLAGLPVIARATAKFQYVYVNGRPIRDRNLAHAIKEAYRGLMPPDVQPVAVVFLDLDPAAVDVNVHPAKAEVRFRDPQRIHGLVLTSLRQRLLASDLTPSANVASAAERLFRAAAGDVTSGNAQGLQSLGVGPTNAAPPATVHSAASFVDYFRRMDPHQKGFVYQQVRQALAEENPEALRDEPPSARDLMDSGPLGAAGRVAPALRAQGVLQVHQSYLVTQDEQGILIVDQHALHERVLFEELRRRVLSQPLESQRLLMPAVVPVSPQRMALLDQLKPVLARIGIEAEPIGPAALGVQAFPSFLFDRKVDPVTFIQELLDRAEEGDFEADGDGRVTPGADADPSLTRNPKPETRNSEAIDESVLHHVLDMMACKAAVKAGDAMGPEELAALLAQRDAVERSSSCPHGRPTTIRLTLRELEKQFKRA